MQSKLETSSVSLIKINEANLPAGSASGCLIDYNDRRLVLTVSHAAKVGPSLAMYLGWDVDKQRVKNWRIGGMNFMGRGQLFEGGKLEDLDFAEVDFAYADVPADLEPKLEKIDPHTGNILESRICKVWTAAAIAEARPEARYGFAGHTMPSLLDHSLISADVKAFFTELRICFPLTFVRQEDDMCAFRLPAEHPGDEYFKGCSGAPIIDEEGHVVALVCAGCTEDSMIFGISLRRYQFALDVHTGHFT